MGLPGAGKTTLASKLVPLLKAEWLNADKIRKEANDWDFSKEGRIRQAKRMADTATRIKENNKHVVADFICPTKEARKLFNADYVVWVNTIEKEGLMIPIICLSRQKIIILKFSKKMQIFMLMKFLMI